MGKGVISDDEDDPVELDEEDMEPIDGDAVDEDAADGDEDEEDEGPDEYEKDDFIVDNVDEEDEQEEEEEEEEERQKKRKRKKKEEYVLDEDDYELLEDNNVIAPRRKGKFKRLKKAQRHAQGDVGGLSDEEEFLGTCKGGRTAEEKLKFSLFGDEEGPPLEDIDEEEEELEEHEDDGEEDEMADFIVHDEVDEAGVPVRQKKIGKKKHRQAPGVSSSALLEAHEIFGDVDDLMYKYKRGLSSTDRKETRIEDEFEPIVISDKYMTEKDDLIREIDVPERIQLYEESTPLDEKSIDDESAWIFNQLASGTVPFFGNSGLGNSISRDDIIRFLNLHHVQKLDVPFIAMYRKEECLSILKDPEHTDMDDQNEKASPLKWHKVLWSIQELHRKWLLLRKRKTALESYYEKQFDEYGRLYDEIRPALISNFESIIKSLKAADSEREVDDVDTKFNLLFPAGEIDVDEGHYKRPKRKSLYSICSKAGLWEVASKFGNTSEQFGLQLSLEEMRTDELEDAKETPEELASNFTCAMFESPQQVLKGARHMAAVEISCEPCVRKYVRSNYLDIFELSTNPTPDGNAAIDPFHQFAGVKWLQRKPLNKFKDAQWLLIQQAEEEKLLQVTIKLPEDRLNKLMSDFNEYYLSDGVSKSAQLWNEQRKLILHDALFSFLLPSMVKEARALLTSRAKNWLLMEYGKVLWNKISVGPYQRKENDINSDDEAAPRVMACCWGPGNPATTFVMLDSSGEVLDVLYTGSLTLRSQNVSDQQRKKTDQERVLKFLTEHQPHVLVLGAANMSCVRLKEDIYEIIFKMVEDFPKDVGHEMDNLTIVYGDESLARLYENSRIASDQLPAQKGIVKRAVALGRYLQNPLAMVATLCGPGREILSWKLNPLENHLTQDEKYTMIEQVMVDITNQVGLDINLAISHEWLFAPLQFISGLGPRKAAFLQRSLVRSGAIFTRKDFMTAHGLSKKVFINAVGFLRVRPSGLAAVSSQLIDLLDDTRIHPESYVLAQELAKDVYEAESANDDEDALEMAIEHVRDRPTFLKNLDVEAYAKSKEREDKLQTFVDIRRELIQGFQDWRKKYEGLSKDEEFYLISGETEDTLAEGRIVQATVRRVQAQRAFCVLESGLTGMLTKDDYSDDILDDLSERLNEGDILACKVKSIIMEKYQVSLVCRESEMSNNRNQSIKKLDTYYHEDRRSLQTEQEKARKEKELARKHFKPRMIVHPRFQNITADEAMKFLSDKDPGESIIRPSSRGPSYLTLTLKVYDGVYAHKEVVEGGKEHKDITSFLRIGKTLTIGDETFEDLDEVMDRYVDPLVSHLKAMLIYRKFRQGTKAEVDELLKNEKLENPKLIVYGFGISHEYPGTFILTYIRSTNPHHEYVGVYPKGFKFRRHQFGSIDKLVAYFQKHINEPQHESGPSIRSVAAMVPMRSPATGGSSGASAGSGWGGSNNEGGWRGQSFDRDRSSTPSSRIGRSGGSGRDGHPSGVPRPSGGRGLGQGTFNNSRGYNERRDSGFVGPTWGTVGSGGGGSSWAAGSGSDRSQESGGRSGGWGAAGANVNVSSGWGGSGGWGAAGAKDNEPSGWGGSGGWSAPGAKENEPSGWGGSGGWSASGAKENEPSGWGGSGGWGAAGAKDNEPSGWGGSGGWGAAGAKDNEPSGWGGSGGWSAPGAKENEPSGWGGSGGWSAPGAKENEPSGWGGSGGWGAAGAKDNEPSGGWGGSDSKKKGSSDGTSGWGSQSGGGGWGGGGW